MVAAIGCSRYTHDTFNGGPGPLVIQPAYNAASGIYEGTQYIYSVSGNTWTLRQQVPLAGAFIFHPEHGHFHFPFAAYGLYTVGADGKPGWVYSARRSASASPIPSSMTPPCRMPATSVGLVPVPIPLRVVASISAPWTNTTGPTMGSR